MHHQKIRILLAEDDLNLGVLLIDYLEAEGFEVKLCKDGEWALSVFEAQNFDLCLLDVMMPKLDGYGLAKAIRLKNKTIPIMFITAKSLKEDKLKGYALGADDYILKPFDEEELLCKIKALIRRLPEKQLDMPIAIASIGQYCFDHQNQSLTINGKAKRLTEKERDILHYLFVNKNVVVKRKNLLVDLWGEDDYFLGRSLDVFITKIRKYLREDKSVEIENVFGVGFVLNVKE
jgi:DNA-binding response OmpR family regulator